VTEMTILVKVYATLRTYTGGEGTLYVDEAETVKDILDKIGVPARDVKNVIVNGRKRDVDHPLADGDRVALFPPIAGG
jgi:molybdopterin converting factor small subunit